MRKALGIIGLLIIITALGCNIYNYVESWDVVLTYKMKFMLYWKPSVLIIIGFILINISIKK